MQSPMKPLRMWLCLSLMVAGHQFCTCAAAAMATPTAQFIAAALRKQEKACGQSLDVTCTWGGLPMQPKPETGHNESRYVRTPKVRFMQITQGSYDATDKWVIRERVTCWLDRKTKEYRELGTSESGSVIGAKTSIACPTRFTSDPMPDVVMKPFSGTELLLDIAGKGIVRKEQELVDGEMCWRVDIPKQAIDSNNGSEVSWSVWLDPKIGYCPRLMVETFERDGFVTEVYTSTFTDYRLFAGKVWMPIRQIVYFDAARLTGSMIEVKTVSIGRKIPDSEISVTFPSGTEVLQLPAGVRRTVP